jgi:hypothetical protein
MRWQIVGPSTIRIVIERSGGCYTCRYFGERREPAVWCAKPGGEHVRSQAERGCAFWERELGTDDELPSPHVRLTLDKKTGRFTTEDKARLMEAYWGPQP